MAVAENNVETGLVRAAEYVGILKAGPVTHRGTIRDAIVVIVPTRAPGLVVRRVSSRQLVIRVDVLFTRQIRLACTIFDL